MANGSQRSTATQTSPPKYNGIYTSAWSSCPKSKGLANSRVESFEFDAEIEPFGDDQILTSAILSDKASSSSGHDQEQYILDDEYARMRYSPPGSCDESTSHDKTPRMRPTEPVYSSPSVPGLTNDTISPNRQDSAYESIKGYHDEESKVDVDIQAGNIRARERVAILRGRVLRTRRNLNDTRLDVQALRAKLRDSTAKLMRAIDELMARDNVQDLHQLAPFYEATRVAQDELGPAEDACDILEIRLNGEEEELEEEEMHFYTHNNITLAIPLSDSMLDEPLTPLVEPYQPDDLFQNLDLENELVKEYLGKAGDAERLKEEIDELENEQFSLTEELNFRTRFKLGLSEEKKAFMFEYPQVYKKLTETLQRVEDDLYDLRDKCIDKGLFGASELVYEPRDALVEDIYDSVHDAEDRLLPLKSAADHTPSFQSHETNFDDKRDYVNAWLLEWVQDSPVEALRLKTFIILACGKEGKEFEGEEWASLVLGWWNKDHAGDEANKHYVLSTMDALLGATSNSRDSEGSLDVDLGDVERIEVEIMGSETGSYGTQKGNQKIPTSDPGPPELRREEQGLVRTRTSSASKALSE